MNLEHVLATPLVTIGYLPKLIGGPRDWLTNPTVQEVCSVGECLCPTPQGWVDLWLHNEEFFYDSIELATKGARGDNRYSILGYRALPVAFQGGEPKPWKISKVSIEPFPESYQLIGFDAVSKMGECWNFQHSPLSCNAMADILDVNRYCLFDQLADAVRAAQVWSRSLTEENGGVEPGDYYVFEVWRDMSTVK